VPRKPNFDFEKREREKAKAAKAAERAAANTRKLGSLTDDVAEAAGVAFVTERGDVTGVGLRKK